MAPQAPTCAITLSPPTIWPAISSTYQQAQASGAATKTETTVCAVKFAVVNANTQIYT